MESKMQYPSTYLRNNTRLTDTESRVTVAKVEMRQGWESPLVASSQVLGWGLFAVCFWGRAP